MDSETDLTLTRVIPASARAIWRCWTEPHLLCQWFSPTPVETIEAVIEPRAGGRFMTRMRLPDGTEIDSDGCILAAARDELLSFTDALGPGFRPRAEPFMTAIITLDEKAGATRYSATVLHASADDRQRHEEMGFHDGWGAATDQLSALAQKIEA